MVSRKRLYKTKFLFGSNNSISVCNKPKIYLA